MPSAPEQPSGIQFTATHIFSALAFFVALCGLAGALVSNQITTLKDDVTLARGIADRRLEQLSAELHRREAEIKTEINTQRQELLDRRQQFPTQFQFGEFKSSIDDRWRTQAEINKQALDAYLSTKAWEAWRVERDKLIGQIERRIDMLERKP
jgi:malate synthase